MEQVKKTILSTAASFGNQNRGLLDKVVDLNPQAKAAKTVSKVAFGITLAVSIILIIIGIALLSKDLPTAGVWVFGAGFFLGAFSIWFHFYRQSMIGAFGGDEFELLDNVYETYEPQDYDYLNYD
jgi:hypothetical protein